MPESEEQKIERERREEQEAQGKEMLQFDGAIPQEGDFIPAETVPPATEEKPPVETPPVETAPPETPPAEEKPVEEKPPETPPEGPPPEKSELEVMKEKMAAMEEQNTALITRLEAEGEPPAPASTEEKPSEETPQPAEVKVSEFVTEEEHTEMFSNRETLNKVLSRVHQAGREAGMRDMPELVRPEVRRQMRIERRVDAFFADNKDLLRVRKYVGKVVGGLVVKGETDIDAALTNAGKLVREELKIPKEEVIVEETKGEETKKPAPAAAPNPAFAGPPGGGTPAVPAGGKTKLPADQAEVSEMIDFAEENA